MLIATYLMTVSAVNAQEWFVGGSPQIFFNVCNY